MSQALSPNRAAAPHRGQRGATAGGAAAAGAHRTLVVAALLLAVTAASACAKANDVVATQPPTSPTTIGTIPVSDSSLAVDVQGRTAGSEPSVATTATTAPVPTTSGPAAGTSPRTSAGSRDQTTTTMSAAGSAPSAAAFCSRNARATDDFENLDPTKDLATYLAMLRVVSAELARLAPPAIKADVQTVADAFASITSVDQMDAITNDPVVKAASDRVTRWTDAHCPDH